MNRIIKLTVCALSLFSLLTAQKAQPQLADSPWPIYGQNVQRSGKSNFVGPVTPDLAWSLKFDDEISPVVVDQNGIIYVNSQKHLYAIYQDGIIKWKLQFDQKDDRDYSWPEGIPAPVVNIDGTIYVHHMDSLFAFSPEGNYKWSYRLGQFTKHYPIVDKNGNINLVGRALSPGGELIWQKDISASYYGVVCADTLGTCYWSTKGNLYAINPDGTTKWQYPAKHPAYDFGSLLSTTKDGTIYCTSGTYYHDELWAFNPDGNLKWSFKISGNPSGPAIDTEGIIYFGSSLDGMFYALNSNGSQKWSFKTDSRIRSNAVIDRNGTIYCPAVGGLLYAINPDGTLKWKYSAPGNYQYETASVSIAGDNLLYFPIANTLYALSVLSGVSDLMIKKITFNPEFIGAPGLPIKVIAEIEDLTGNTSSRCTVSFFLNNISNPIGNTEVFVPAGKMNYGEITWNTATYSPGEYTIIAKIHNVVPTESDTTNNIASTTLSLLPFIQPRIDAASSGDTICVEPGTYYENLKIHKNVVVMSKQGPQVTIIDGKNSGRVVSIGSSAVIDGFTITNGQGGVSAGGSSIIRNNIIVGNTASVGGGIDAFGLNVSARIERNLIMNNTATLRKGSGIYAPNSNAKIINNTIINNTGDGINTDALNFALPTIVNCIIWGNGDDLKGSATASYSCIEDGDPGFGNISIDPQFIDPANGDYRLKCTSPCLDAGNPKIQDPDGSRSDIGAFPVFQGGGRFGAPINLIAEDTPNDPGGSISLMWESPPPTLEISANNIILDSLDLGAYFFIKNIGLGMLNWAATSDKEWLQLTPDDGSVMLGNGQLFALVTRKNLFIGDYSANIKITSNGGSENISVNMRVGKTPEPGNWQGSGINFDVTEDMRNISELKLIVGPSNNQYTYILHGYIQIQSDQTFIHESGDVKITGKFESRKTVSGTYNIPHPISPTGTWSASWQPGLLKEKNAESISGQLSNEELLISKYNIYRSQSSGRYDSLLASVAGNIFEYIDNTTVDNVEYFYIVKAVDQNGNLSDPSNEAGPVISTLVKNNNQTLLPSKFGLSQNHPNPFNPETTIKYQLPDPSEVMIRIFNITGQVVKTILEEHQPAGYHSILWDGKDDLRSNVSSGVYFYQLFAKAAKVGQVYTETRKMVLVR